MKKYLTEKFFKGLGKYFYDELIYPAAKDYVSKSSNVYDDVSLEFLDGLIDDFLEDKEEDKE